MPALQDTGDEVERRGQEIYERDIRPMVEASNQGKFLVINIETGEYEMDTDDLAAAKHAKARFGKAPLFTMRIGHPAAYRLGFRAYGKQP